jgi:hypothetical protein
MCDKPPARKVSMKSRLVGVYVVMGMIVLAGVVGYAGMKRAQPSEDPRQRIVLAAAERDKVLGEMRQMLASISKVLHGFVSNDLAVIEKAARASGTATAADPQLEWTTYPSKMTMSTTLNTTLNSF